MDGQISASLRKPCWGRAERGARAMALQTQGTTRAGRGKGGEDGGHGV